MLKELRILIDDICKRVERIGTSVFTIEELRTEYINQILENDYKPLVDYLLSTGSKDLVDRIYLLEK